MNRICKLEDCQMAVLARGLCRRHYNQHYAGGTLDDYADPPHQGEPFHRLSGVDRAERTATCSICGPTKVRLRGNRSPQCVVPHDAERKRYRERRPRPAQNVSKDERKRWKYRLSAEAYARLLERAGGCCELCGVDIVGAERIDHCHATSLVRGVLCNRCNIGLGWFDDDPARLLAAHLYVKANGKLEA